MTEIIRYGIADSSLGSFTAALSQKGLVALEFDNRGQPALAAIRERLPDAQLQEATEELAPALARLAAVIDDPSLGEGITLDPRGSDYERQVWQMLQSIPLGETTSYGALAARLGTRDAREVTAAIAGNGIAVLIPCHRVVKKDGAISGYRWGVERKRKLLAREQQSKGFALV